jgi:hypothetical protein
LRIEFLDSAKKDLVSGYRFYEWRTAGLGSYFLDSIYADIDSLLLYAGIHCVVFGSYRMLASRFPFAIFYRLEKDVIRVRAILDCRRDPTWIKRRVTDQ